MDNRGRLAGPGIRWSSLVESGPHGHTL